MITHAHFCKVGFYGYNTMGAGTEVYSKGKKKLQERETEGDELCMCVSERESDRLTGHSIAVLQESTDLGNLF